VHEHEEAQEKKFRQSEILSGGKKKKRGVEKKQQLIAGVLNPELAL